jgi:hypothetical protein
METTYVHIYRAEPQPATRWELDVFGDGRPPMVVTHAPTKRLWCYACYRRRQAKNLVAHVYYDGTYYFCREKEYGRSSEFPFEYRTICKGTAFRPRRE